MFRFLLMESMLAGVVTAHREFDGQTELRTWLFG